MPDPKDQAITDLTVALQEATDKLQVQDKILKEMAELPGMLARVTHVFPKDQEGQRLIVDGRILVMKPSNIKQEVEVGSWLHVNKSMTGAVAIVGLVDVPETPAMVMKIAEVLPDGRAFIEFGPGNLIPLKKVPASIPVEVGDRVLLGGEGPSTAVVLENLGKGTKSFQHEAAVEITWDDIGGQIEAKAAMREAIEYPILYKEMYAAMGKKPIKGVVLAGPPGVGKTLLGKAAATAISKLHGKKASSTGYIYVKGPEVLSKWVGEAESTIRTLFLMAAEHKKKQGYPAIMFIDECEALLGRRGSGLSSDMEKTIVPSFLAEMDGLNDSGALVVLATNKPERLDPAVVRDGRIDRRIMLNRPNLQDTTDIFGMYLRKVPSCNMIDSIRLAEYAGKAFFSPEYTLFQIDIGKDEPLAFTLGSISSGAMIAGVVDRATSNVIHAAIAAKQHVAKLEESHLDGAIAQSFKEVQNIDHMDDIKMLAEQHGGRPKSITKIIRQEVYA